MKTSESHPLRVDPVQLPCGGTIGLTFCPGKKQLRSMSGPWDRDLGADLDRIAAFGATVLVTLMEADELAGVEVPVERLAGETAARGMEWYHLPIVDVHVPDDGWERLWLLAGPRLRSRLQNGRKIVLHCRGGLGRAGTVAGRLVVELGADPEEAIQEIRAARPGSIETFAQEEHVRSAASVGPELRPADRIAGSLIAGAIGDALGAPIEFQSLDRIREEYGPDGLRAYAPAYGRIGAITDDTQMLMFTAEGLLRGFLHDESPGVESLAKAVWRGYRRWLRTQKGMMPKGGGGDGWLLNIPGLWNPRAPGNTCLGSLMSGEMGTVESPLGFSKGCGGIMRVAPVGLVGGLLKSTEEVLRLGNATAVITHGHPAGYYSAGFLAAMLDGIMKGKTCADSWEEAETILRDFRQPENANEVHLALDGVRAALAANDPTPKRLETLGGGWVGEEALAISLYAAMSHDDLEEALLLAVNHSGDTDSTGAIAGNILGAAQGAGAIPPHLWRPVEHLQPLLTLAQDLTMLVDGRADTLRRTAADRYPAD